MPTIPVEQARAGMTLVANLQDSCGRLLLRSGDVLTERHLEKLARWGVATIQVANRGAGDPAAVPAKSTAPPPPWVAPEAVAARFRLVRSDPLLAELERITLATATNLAAAWRARDG